MIEKPSVIKIGKEKHECMESPRILEACLPIRSRSLGVIVMECVDGDGEGDGVMVMRKGQAAPVSG